MKQKVKEETEKYAPVIDGNRIANPDLRRRSSAAMVKFVTDRSKVSIEASSILEALLQNYPNAWSASRKYSKDLLLAGSGYVGFKSETVGEKTCLRLSFGCVQNEYMHAYPSTEKQLLTIVKKVLSKGPSLDEAHVKLIKGKLLRNLNVKLNTPTYIALRALLTTFFPDSPDAKNELNPEKLAAATADQVRAAFEAYLSSPNVLSFIGFDGAEPSLFKLFPATEVPHVKRDSWDLAKADGSLLSLKRPNVKASVIARTYSFPDYEEDDQKASMVRTALSTMISGADSILFTKIREEGGFAYNPEFAFLSRNVGLVLFKTEKSKADRAVKFLDDVMSKIKDFCTQALLDMACEQIRFSYRDMIDSGIYSALEYQVDKLLFGQNPNWLDNLKSLKSINLEDVNIALNDVHPLGGVILSGEDD